MAFGLRDREAGVTRGLDGQDDIVDLVRLLYWTVGGRRWYSRQPPAIKSICRGLRRDLILERFPRATQLRAYLESFPWLSVL